MVFAGNRASTAQHYSGNFARIRLVGAHLESEKSVGPGKTHRPQPPPFTSHQRERDPKGKSKEGIFKKFRLSGLHPFRSLGCLWSFFI